VGRDLGESATTLWACCWISRCASSLIQDSPHDPVHHPQDAAAECVAPQWIGIRPSVIQTQIDRSLIALSKLVVAWNSREESESKVTKSTVSVNEEAHRSFLPEAWRCLPVTAQS
jgi:hypothetical protein